MITRPNPIHCIVPPHIIRALLAHEEERVRQAALRTLTTSVRLRERRRILGPAMLAVPAGTLRRTIYNAGGLESLPGQLVPGGGRSESRRLGRE